MQRRFMSDPLVRATELLLQERVPADSAPSSRTRRSCPTRGPPATEQALSMRVFPDPDTPIPEVHLLSNGRYHVMVTNAGGGYSRWQRPGRHPLARGRHLRRLGHVHLPARPRPAASTGRPRTSRRCKQADALRGDLLQARAEFRRRDHGDRDAHRDQRVARRRRRDPPRPPHQPFADAPRHRGDQLRGGGAGAADCRRAASARSATCSCRPRSVRERQAILCTRRPRSAASRSPGCST